MKLLQEYITTRLCLVTLMAFSTACTEGVPSADSFPKRLLAVSGVYDVTYYGYADDQRYEAVVGLDDIDDGDTLESAMSPARAAELGREALDVLGKTSAELMACEVALTKHIHGKGFFYLVTYCPGSQKAGVGFRVPVLLSGRTIHPVVSEDQS